MKFFMLALMLLSFNGWAKKVSIMTYNAENLYDTEHDKGKSDYKWLPVKFKRRSREVQEYCNKQKPEHRDFCLNYDWNESVLRAKLYNLAEAIKAYHGNRAPDIVVLQEVENLGVLRDLVKIGLKYEGYKDIALVDGPDKRGIDIGIISKYPIVRSKLHTVSLRGTSGSHRTTRGIFEVNIKVNNKIITVFGNHWPSQANGDDTRLKASEILERLTRDADGDVVVATGDFNTYDSDSPHGINRNVLPYYYDSEAILRRRVSYLNPGTHWFRGHWSSLDKIFVSKSSVSKGRARVDWDSYKIVNNSFLVHKYYEWTDSEGRTQVSRNVPYRFDAEEKRGASDHLPVAVTLDL